MGIYDLDRNLCVSFEKYIAVCPGCGRELLKKRMVTLLAKSQYSNPRTIGHFCESCFTALCEQFELKG